MTTATMASAPVYPAARQAWGSAVVIFILTSIAMADRFAISMLIGPIKAEFALGDFKASLLIGLAFTSFYVLFLLPIGWAADRFSRRGVLAVCLLIWSLAAVSCGFATGFAMLFVLRMLIGAGEAGLAPAAHGIIGASFPRHQLTKPMALQHVGLQVGGALGVAGAGAILSAGAAGKLAGLPLIGDLAPWRVAFIAIGLPGLVALLLIPLLVDPKPVVTTQTKLPPFLPFLRENAFVVGCFVMTAGISAMGFGSITAWSPELLMRQYQVAPAQAGAAFGGVMLVASVISQVVYSVVVDALAKRRVYDAPIRIGLVPISLSIPVAWLAYRAADADAFLAWQFVLLLCLAPCGAMVNTCMQQLSPPEFRSRLSALTILVISLLGFSLGPATSGWLSEYVFGEDRLALAVSIVIVTAMSITVALMVMVRRPLGDYVAARANDGAAHGAST